jgi:hypothetical protein
MQNWRVAVVHCRDRRGRGDHLDGDSLGAWPRPHPAIEAERKCGLVENQTGLAGLALHDRSVRQIVQLGGPQAPVRATVEAATAAQSLEVQQGIDLTRQDRLIAAERGGQCIAVRAVGIPPT